MQDGTSGKKNQRDCCCLVGLFSLDGRWDVRKNDGWMDAWMDGGTNFDGAEALGLPWGAQVAMGVVEGPSGVPSRRERRRARNVTHTMVWSTGASETIGFHVYFAHALTKRKLVQDRGAPNAT